VTHERKNQSNTNDVNIVDKKRANFNQREEIKMGAMNKANGRQNTRHKAKYAAYATRGIEAANKKRNIAQDLLDKTKSEAKLMLRVATGKPVPKRFMKRHGLLVK
jgi:hypothetical protein